MTKAEIAQKLRTARNKTGMTQSQVAEIIGKSQKLVGHWETGYSQPDADTLSVLLRLYNVDANTFFEIEEAPKKREPADDISVEASTRLLVGLGFIREGEQLSDADLSLLSCVFGILDAWFSRDRG